MGKKSVTTSAVYRHGVLELDHPLDLPEDSRVQVEITAVQPLPDQGFGSAYGIFPELADMTYEEIEEVTKLWSESAEAEIRRITEAK
jgi:predicted DNA-binding antitoxin AbrB/MazE fold protein